MSIMQYRHYLVDRTKVFSFVLVASLTIQFCAPVAAQSASGSVFKDCSWCPEMVVMPLGSFEMGSNDSGAKNTEKPVHLVKIDRSFAIGKTEVTKRLWKEVMGSDPSTHGCSGGGLFDFGGDCPVNNVRWDEARVFIRKLNAKIGKYYRLPSEAEWEYACRAGGKHQYCGSDDFYAIAGNGDKVHSVGSNRANAWGLFDMNGNVWEWVEDCWHSNYSGAPTDGSAWSSSCEDAAEHVLRGGGWHANGGNTRAATRYKYNDDGPLRGLGISQNGLRLARDIP